MSVINLNVSFLPNGDHVEFKKQEKEVVAEVFSNTLSSVCYPLDPSYATISTIPQKLQSSPKKIVRWLTRNQYVPIIKDAHIFFEPLSDPDFENIKKRYELVAKSNKISIFDLLTLQDCITNSKYAVRNTCAYNDLVKGIEALVIGLTESFEVDCSIQESKALSNSNSFIHEGQMYVIKFTSGNGSCALHSLLGQETQGIYRFPGSNCDVEAKKHFTNALQNALDKQDPGVITHFISILKDYLHDARRKNGTFEAKFLFSTTSAGCEFSKKWRELQVVYLKKIEAIQIKKASTWLMLAKENKAIYNQLMLTVELDLTLSTERYPGKSKEETWQALLSHPIEVINIIDTRPSDFLILLESSDSANMVQLEDELRAVTQDREESEQSFILSDAMVTHYIGSVTQPQFYLNTNEIKLGAVLFSKNVFIFGGEPIELVEKINETSGDETVIIYHRGAHFSRCVKVQGLGEENEPNVPEKKDSNMPSWNENEDACPSGTFIFQDGKIIKVSPDSIDVQISREDAEGFYLQSCDFFADDPAFLYPMAQTPSIPKAQAIHFQFKALGHIIKSSTEEYQKAIDQADFEKSSQILEKQESLKQKKTNLQKDQTEFKKLLKLKISEYFKKSFELLIIGGEEQQKDFFALFKTLRKLIPQSLIPFHPLLTLLAGCLEKATLKYYMEEAKKCDPHLTYALIVGYACSAHTYNKLTMFERYKADAVLEVLQEVYPQDLVLPILLAGIKSDSGEASIELSLVSAPLERALHALALGEIQTSIEQIANITPLLCGYAMLHRYLAVAWSCYGDFAKAKKITKRASQLPNFHTQNLSHFVSQIIMDTFKAAIPSHVEIPKGVSEVPDDPLADCVEMFQAQPLSLALATSFVKKATSSLKSDVQQIPLVYFGIQNLASRLSVGSHENFETTYRPLFNALFECISILLDVCYTTGDLDPWIAEISKKKMGKTKNNYSFLLSSPSIQFGLSSVRKKETPLFKFFDNLELTSQSICSIATCTTREVYGLLIALMTSHLMPAFNDKNLPLPDDSLVFIGIIQSGLLGGTKGLQELSFKSSVAHLKKYLDLKPADRPYPIDHEVLEWAKFCVFSLNSTIDIPENSYYRENFSKLITKDIVQNVYKKLIAPDKLDGILVQNGTRDVFLADHYLTTRSMLETITLFQTNNLYSLYRIAQRLFGWHYQESFTEWGIRLKNAEISGPGASDFNQMEHMAVDVTLQSNNPTIEGYLPAMERIALRALLQFWLEFHKKTTEKNAFILSGGDEDNAVEAKDWVKGIDLKDWLHVIEKNAPQSYPNFNTLSKREQEALTQVVNNKHKHYLEVQELEKICAKSGHLSSERFVVNMATVLLINAEFDRSNAYHSVFMENENQARRLYQLLLEISVERIVRNALITAGIDGWVDFNRIGDILSNALHHLIGTFHGPEAHFSGNGPTQWHYNAGIVTSKLRSQNIHIYYNQ